MALSYIQDLIFCFLYLSLNRLYFFMRWLFINISLLLIFMLSPGCATQSENELTDHVIEITSLMDSSKFTQAISLIDSLDNKPPIILNLKVDALSGRAGLRFSKIQEIINLNSESIYNRIYKLSESSSDSQIHDIENAISLVEEEHLIDNHSESWKMYFKFAVINLYRVSLYLRKYLKEDSPDFDFCSEQSLPSSALIAIIHGINKSLVALSNSIENGNLDKVASDFKEELELFNLIFIDNSATQILSKLSESDLIKFRNLIGQNMLTREFICY